MYFHNLARCTCRRCLLFATVVLGGIKVHVYYQEYIIGGGVREYRTWIFKMPSKSRAPGIDHPTDDVFRRAYIRHTDAVGHVTLHFEF
jgi:hypothetical protein